MEIIKANNITKKFAAHTALNNVSISIPTGKIYGLLGPNGAGKTTFIRIINQIIAPDEGEIFFGNEKLSPHHIAQIGYLPEERGLYKKMKVGEQALYLARLKGLSKNAALAKLKYWFEKFEIQSWWDKKVEELSKGMQQKIQFIVTILHEPKLLIFDEPFSGFDPINTNLLKKEILDLKKNGTTIIFSTHNMESVEEICDNIALINNSQKILEGPIDEIKQAYRSNTYKVLFSGFFDKVGASLSANYDMFDVTQTKDGFVSKFRLMNGFTTNELITSLLRYGKIAAFNEIIPSMNDIFIQVVENDKS